MTTEKTIVVHTERPEFEVPRHIQAYHKTLKRWYDVDSMAVDYDWGTDYTAWYDPQIGEVERPARYVVVRQLHAPAVLDGPCDDHYCIRDRKRTEMGESPFVADDIPTRSAAQRIADIYNEVAG